MTTYFLYLFVQRLNWKILTFFSEEMKCLLDPVYLEHDA